jgi:hypothetical protein
MLDSYENVEQQKNRRAENRDYNRPGPSVTGL